ncbi:MAG: hypothetical protein R3B47_12045 [Bacteroidia bacterium]
MKKLQSYRAFLFPKGDKNEKLMTSGLLLRLPESLYGNKVYGHGELEVFINSSGEIAELRFNQLVLFTDSSGKRKKIDRIQDEKYQKKVQEYFSSIVKTITIEKINTIVNQITTGHIYHLLFLLNLIEPLFNRIIPPKALAEFRWLSGISCPLAGRTSWLRVG